MRPHQAASLLLTAASCLTGHLGWAQQAPIAPLAPAAPVVALPRSDLGTEIQDENLGAKVLTVTTLKQNRPATPELIYIINGRYISNINALSTINPQQIAKIDIYKQEQSRSRWQGLSAFSIIDIALKTSYKTKLKAMSLAAIKRKLGLPGPVRFELNGAPMQDESLQIVTDAIAGFDVTQTTSATANMTVVNIRLAPYKPKLYPPGSIMIRGVAAQ